LSISPLGLYSANLEATGFCVEIWTVGEQPVSCAVCWRAVLLEDEPGEQPAIALKTIIK